MSNSKQIAEGKVVISNARVRHWRAGSHSPYPGMLHDADTDERIDWRDALLRYLRGLNEGDRISIVISVERATDMDPSDYWTLTDPHTYAHARTVK